MKILFLSSWFPNKLEPTNGNFIQRHAEAVALEHEVEILHTIGDFNQTETFVFDDKVINGIRTLIVYYKNSKNPVQNFLRRMKAYKMGFAKMQKPDLVHANVLHNNMLFAVYLKRKFKIPFVVSEHWTALQHQNLGKTSGIIKWIAKFIAKNASYILPVSENLLESLRSLGIKIPMKVISNVVNTEVFDIKINDENPTVKFLHISSLIPRKRPDKIIEAIYKLKQSHYNVSLEIGGDGDTETLRNLIKKLNAENYISVFDEISYAEVAEKMQNSDCFILFSDNETQGCVILESYACGKPVIATAVGGVPEFVKPGFGILIEKANETELYEAMKSFADQKMKFEKPEILRQYVLDNFSKESICRQFTAIYNQVVKG
ncbi:glycosyltransferase family 4 protein [Chryseobacterium sp. SC28]|uniref:glycosyltransferase family 4 protein n=1 Tax=Chryseobacterium sp. SC28 TaxID=2268028 RepID=UPI000F647488|nr:glycosyltransferase family 4 protein [Chryseobacterium sp. SC28]RRQ47057.1 glycosyltransferase family 4 protein [Chryseobacterium sp. SC28]